MSDPSIGLKNMQTEHEFFIGIDSDGCVFDTMEIKQKECFCPNFIYHFDLQPMSRYARETWEFVNLYSSTRGVNRFHAIIRALELLERRPETKERNVHIEEMNGLKEWVSRETKLGNPALQAEIQKTENADLKKAYEWSLAVNKDVGRMVKNVPPFPYVRDVLTELQGKADAIVVSQTPFEALDREWREHTIADYVRMIAGQEMGTKAQHIEFAASGKYESNKMLMIGDAPGDLKAAKSNKSLFFPIIPGREEESWKRLATEGLAHFFSGDYAGNYEAELIREFEEGLPETPPWEE